MRVLLFAQQSKLKNVGGPTGYLYNISQYLKENPNNQIYFLPEKRLKRTFWGLINTTLFLITKKICKKSSHLNAILEFYSMFFRYERFSNETIDYLNTFDFIHMHHAPYFIHTFKKNKINAKLIVTSHSPEPYVNETISMAGLDFIFDKFPKMREYFLKKELSIYDYCDKIMFPVPQAREPYEVGCQLFKDKFKQVDSKFFYVPTALGSIEMISGFDNYLGLLNIAPSVLKLCYVGRHNDIKGYDFLKESAIRVWEKDPNITYIIGGKQEPMKGLNDDRWHELGWVNTSLLLNEIDAFILPNKNTYFDLILLEALRQGTPVILTRTGGNKWFEKFNLPGLLFFDEGDYIGLIKCIERIKNYKRSGDIKNVMLENRKFLQKEFDMSLYIDRYIDKLESFIIH